MTASPQTLATATVLLATILSVPVHASCVQHCYTDGFSQPTIGTFWQTNVPDGGSIQVVDGELQMSVPGAVRMTCTANQDPLLSVLCGDFDVQVEFRLISFPLPEHGDIYTGMRVYTLDNNWASTIERYNNYRIECMPSTSTYKTFCLDSYNCGGDVTWLATSDQTGRFRIARAYGTITTYYWQDGNWYWLSACSNITGSVYVQLYLGGRSAATVAFDNFVVVDSPTVEVPSDPGTGQDLVVRWTLCSGAPGTQTQACLSQTPDPVGDPAPLLSSAYTYSGPGPQVFVHKFGNLGAYKSYYASERSRPSSASDWGPFVTPEVNVARMATMPVFLVHGLYGTASSFDTIKDALRGAGVKYCYEVTGLDPYGVPGENDFSGNAMIMSAFIEQSLGAIEQENLAEYPNEVLRPAVIDIVGHSMGGLIARRYIAGLETWCMLGQQRGVSRLFTLGTPNLGTAVGGIAGQVCAHSVAPVGCSTAPGELSKELMRAFQLRYFDIRGAEVFTAAGIAGRQDCNLPVSSLPGVLGFTTLFEDCPNDGIVSEYSAIYPYFMEISDPHVLVVNANHYSLKTDNGVINWLVDNICVPRVVNPGKREDAGTRSRLEVLSSTEGSGQIIGWDCFSVAGTDARVDTLISDGGDLDLELFTDGQPFRYTIRSASGQAWDEATVATDPNVYYTVANNQFSHIFPSASPGPWVVTVRAGATGDPAAVCVTSATNSFIRADFFVSNLAPAVGDSVTALVTLSDDVGPIRGGTGSCQVRQLPSGAVESLEFIDDGQHSDGAPEDGVYGLTMLPPSETGVLEMAMTVSGHSNAGVAFTRISHEAVVFDPDAVTVPQPGLISFVPNPQTISRSNGPSGGPYRNSVVASCQSAGSGPIYGYSIDVTWDPAVLSAAPADFARPSQGDFATAGVFITSAIPNGVRIDAALGGARGGIGRGDLFKATFTALGSVPATSALHMQINSVRDRHNVHLSGFTTRDGRVDINLGAPTGTDTPGFAGPSRIVDVVPNPFNPRTTIVFELSTQAGAPDVRIYDVAGHIIRKLGGRSWPAGRNTVEWDGKDDGGRDVPSGRYLVQLRAADTRSSRALTLVR